LPPKQAKPIFINYITDNHVDDVIMLLGSLKPRSREAILKTFTTEQDLEMLYKIQRKMLAGEPVKPFIDAKLQELEQLQSQDK
jgi:Mg/Co/Ni transporter MgtE